MSAISKALDFIKPSKVNPMATQGHGGVPTFGGFISDVEKSPTLKGNQKYTTYSNVLVNTSIVSAGVRYFTNLVSKATWKAEPVDDTPAAHEAAEFVEEVLKSTETSWSRIVRKSSLYRFYGYSIQEWTAVRRADGKIGLKDIEFRSPSTIERWDIDMTGTLNGVVQRSPHTQAEIYLPRTKLIYLVDDCLSDSPEGLGLFRHLVDPAQRLARYEVLEGFGFEADLRGVPVAKAPIAKMAQLVEQGLMTKEQKAAAEQPLRDFITNHIKNPKLGLLLDSSPYFSLDESGSPSGSPQWGVDILNVNTSSQEAVAAAINRLNMEIARILNVEGLLLGADSKGSYALSRDKTNALYLIVDSSLNEIREGYQKDIVDTLWTLNGFDPALKPKLKTEAIQFRDIEQVTAALRDMATAGATLAPNDPAINEVRDMIGLSHAPEEDETDMALGNDSLEADNEDAEEIDSSIEEVEKAEQPRDEIGRFASTDTPGISSQEARGFKTRADELLSKDRATRLALNAYSLGVGGAMNRDRFKGVTSFRLNKKLREGKVLDPDEKQVSTLLDGYLSKSKLPRDVKLYRGMALDSKVAGGFSEGQVLKNKAFSSVTWDPHLASSFSNRKSMAFGSIKESETMVKLTILAKKGSKAGYVPNFSAKKYDSELLLPRGASFKIKSVIRLEDLVELEVEYE